MHPPVLLSSVQRYTTEPTPRPCPTSHPRHEHHSDRFRAAVRDDSARARRRGGTATRRCPRRGAPARTALSRSSPSRLCGVSPSSQTVTARRSSTAGGRTRSRRRACPCTSSSTRRASPTGCPAWTAASWSACRRPVPSERYKGLRNVTIAGGDGLLDIALAAVEQFSGSHLFRDDAAARLEKRLRRNQPGVGVAVPARAPATRRRDLPARRAARRPSPHPQPAPARRARAAPAPAAHQRGGAPRGAGQGARRHAPPPAEDPHHHRLSRWPPPGRARVVLRCGWRWPERSRCACRRFAGRRSCMR